MKVSADVRAMIERRKQNYTLEAPFYTGEDIFAIDIDAIFRQHWIQVAVEPDVPEPGDYVTVEIGDDSILIVRDDDMPICLATSPAATPSSSFLPAVRRRATVGKSSFGRCIGELRRWVADRTSIGYQGRQ